MYMKKIAIGSEYKINSPHNIFDHVHLNVVNLIVAIS